ncbi:MAG TPA: glycosyltransferase [Nocardioidaceae bacterium]|nr:glycosyltransferase [Nocardioidaceae bacterium]
METLAAGVWRSMTSVRPDSRKISHGGGNRALMWWVPLCLLRLIWLCLRGRVEYVLCGDALMNSLCAPILRLFGVRRFTMVMGLDVTYEQRFYRSLVHPRLRSAEHVIAISQATADATASIGVRADRLSVLRLGVSTPGQTPDHATARALLVSRLGLDADKQVLLTLGRLVPRKGVRWFVDEVLPRLPDSVHYAIAGAGPELDAIRDAADRRGVADRCHLLGNVDDEYREVLMRGCEIFVQPNVAVPGDMEGFGLVTVEAAMRDTLVVAADLEGIKDAVIPESTGFLLESADPDAWVLKLRELLASPVTTEEQGVRFGAEARRVYSDLAMGTALAKLLG